MDEAFDLAKCPALWKLLFISCPAGGSARSGIYTEGPEAEKRSAAHFGIQRRLKSFCLRILIPLVELKSMDSQILDPIRYLLDHLRTLQGINPIMAV